MKTLNLTGTNKMRFTSKLLSILLLSTLFSYNANAAQKYCTKQDVQSKFIIHIYGESYQNDDDKRLFLRGLDKLQSRFTRGDKIRIVNHTGAQATTKLDKCLPGCPKKSMIGSMFNSECSEQVAKKDMVLFKRKYVKIIKNALSKSSNEYNVIDHLVGLDDYHRGRKIDNQKVFVFHSLLPFGVDPNDTNSFNASFVRVSQSNKLFDLNVPDVVFVNPNRSKATLKFWDDLGYNGHEEGLNIDFNTEIID